MDFGEFAGMMVFFLSVVTIVKTIVNSPKARARAELIKQQQLAVTQDEKNLLSAVRAEEIDMNMQAQEKRIASLEDEVSFLRRVLEDKTSQAAR
jgi:hypothetical protein